MENGQTVRKGACKGREEAVILVFPPLSGLAHIRVTKCIWNE